MKDPIILGDEKVEIDGFVFWKNKAVSNPFFLMMTLICCDPTEKQKEVLDKFEVKLLDDEDNSFYPREEKKEEKKEEEK
jgi:hypothetical protein